MPDTPAQQMNEAWKQADPYRIRPASEPFEVKWTGSCHCGRIQYQLSRDKPLASKYCHCKGCQKLHGAPFQWAAIFHKSDINFTKGVEGLGWWASSVQRPEHELPCKVYCEYCRTPIMDEGRNMVLLFPPLIHRINSPEAKEAFKPQCHLFYPCRVVDFTGDGLVKWAGIDGKSPVLDDAGKVVEKT